MVLYIIFDKSNDIEVFRTVDKASALMRAGEIFDAGYVKDMVVELYEMTAEEYDDMIDPDDNIKARYTLGGFIERFGEDPEFKELTPAEAERLINLSPEEKDFVVMHIPDATLIAELSRRVKEYRKYTEKVAQADAELRIFI